MRDTVKVNLSSNAAGMDARSARMVYRIRQFMQGFAASVAPDELDRVALILPPQAMTLFLRMPVDAQRHSLNVLQTLASEGDVLQDLACAALLHDAGKIAADKVISLWMRVPLVLLDALLPTASARMARAEPQRGWRYLLHVHREHPAIGAAWAREAGCTPLTCALIERHQEALPPLPASDDDPETALLRRLQCADNAN